MVRKPLPKHTLNEVRRIFLKKKVIQSRVPFEKNKSAKKFFLKLKSADYREPDSESHRWLHTQSGFSVRSIKTQSGRVILKVPDLYNAKEEIQTIRRGVRLINSLPNKGFILLQPNANVIGPFIAMKRTVFPSLFEMTGGYIFQKGDVGPTKRGKRMLFRIAKSIGKSEAQTLSKLQWAHASLERSAKKAAEMQKEKKEKGFSVGTYESRNLLVLGIKNNKVLFLPLIDPI